MDRLLSLSALALAAFDPAGTTLYLSPAFQRITGYGLDDIPDLQAWWLRAFPDECAQVGGLAPGAARRVRLSDGREADLTVSVSTAESGTFVLVSVEGHGRATEAMAPLPVGIEDISDRTFEGIGIHQNGIFVYVNAVLAGLLGLPPEKVVGRNVLDFLMPEFHEKAVQMMRDPKLSTHMEMVARDNAGKPFHCELLGKPYTCKGQSARLIAVRDISVRRMAEAYRQQMTWLNLALSSSRAGTWEWRLDGSQIIWSEDLWRLYGVPRAEAALQFADWLNIIHPDDRSRVIEEVKVAVKHRRAAEVEYRVVHSDGTVIWLLSHGHPLFDDEGRLERYLGVVFDITQRKLMEDALRTERDFVNAVVEDAGNVILVLDRAGNIVRFNRAAQELTGFSLEEISGKPVWDFLIPPESQDEVRGVFQALLHQKLAGIHENEWLCKDGGRRLLSWCNTTLMNGEGETAFVVALGYDITDMRRNEDRLSRALSTLRSLIEAIPYPMFLKDASLRYAECNENFCTMMDLPRESVIGATVFDVAGPEQAQVYAQSDQELLVSREASQVYETVVIGRSGKERQVLFHKRKLHDADGAVAGIVGIVIDVTDFRRTEQSLRDREAELERHRDRLEELVAERTSELAGAEAHIRAIIDSSGDGIIELDAGGRVLLVNPAATRILACTPGDLLGRNLHDAIHHSYPDGRPYPIDDCPTYNAMRQELPQRPLEDVFWRADGSSIEVGVSAHPIHSDGVMTGSVVTFQDISERKQAERKNAALAAIVENTDNIIVTKDLNLRVVATNMAFARVTGHASPAEVVGMTDAEIFGVTPETEPVRTYMEDERQAQRLKRGEFILREEPVVSHEGEIRHVLTRKYPIFDSHDRVIGTGNISMDITERKRAEEAMEEARRAAEQLARTKSEFLANMSHEIRTPLNGVLGLAQIGYRDSEGRHKAQDTFARILESGKLLLAIINDILDFSKIEAGRLEIESTPLSPSRLVDDIVRGQALQAANKNLRLLSEKSSDLPAACLGDSTRLSQIMLNLLSNAIKFTEKGEIRVGAYRDGPEILFRVSDTGIGMSPDVLARLFRPFEQADGSTTRKYGGTGLGLAISRRLAELMGARISVSSEPGRGSTFELRLPLLEAEPLPAEHRPFKAPGEKRLAGLHILAAEDTPINQLVLEDFLRREGAEVMLVSDGLQAVKAVESGRTRFHAVLMDVQMPLMDGIEATRHIKRMAPDLPVIGQTAHALKEEHERCRDAGMSKTIVKPLDIDLLVTVLLEQCIDSDGGPPVEPRSHGKLMTPLPVDWALLGARFLNRREVIDRLVTVAVRSNADKPLLLRAAAEALDYQTLNELAHALKGTGGNLACAEVERLAVAVMKAASSRDPDTVMLAQSLASAVERLLDYLKQGMPEAM